MIRFSAAMVAVAIGVLIGGIATSELSLVYIAIVVSAVALVALAIGVVLKREELFGEGQGLVTAAAGVSPELPARAGESQDKVAGTHVAPPPSSAGAAAGYAPVVGNTVAGGTGSGSGVFGATAFGRGAPPAPTPAAAAPSAPRTAPTGQGRPGDPGSVNPGSAKTMPPWESQGAPGPRPPLAADWMSAGQGDRGARDVGATAGRPPSARQDTAQPPTTQSGWGLPDADVQAAPTAPRSWAPRSSSPAPAGAPEVRPAGGSGSAAPSWFDRLGARASTAEPTSASGSAPPTVSAPTVSTPTVSAPPAVPGGEVSGDTESGDQVSGKTVSGSTVSDDKAPGNTVSANTEAGGDDDDWPTRYAWLDDDTDETGGAADETGGAADETGGAADAVAGANAAVETAATPTVDAGAASAPTTRTRRLTGPPTTTATPATVAGHRDEPDDDAANAVHAEEPDAHIIAFPSQAGTASTLSASVAPHDGLTEVVSAAGVDEDAEAHRDGKTGSAPTAGDDAASAATRDTDTAADAATDATAAAAPVTVVPGVPRYHRPDCVLIRFMPEGDVQKLPVAEAKDAGCTPCAACQPAG